LDFLKKLEILCPPESILQEFQKQFDSMFNSICSYLRQNELLKQSRDLLLPRLISGKVSVAGLRVRS